MWPTDREARKRLEKSSQFGQLDFSPLLEAQPKDDQTLNFRGKYFYVARSFPKPGTWSMIGLTPLRAVSMARLAGILMDFSVCLVMLGFFVALVHSADAREAAEELLKLKEEVNTLSGIVPICASCKKIRDDKGYWTRVETYVSQHSQAQFSHGLCPECSNKLYPEYSDKPEDPGDDKP
jgi:hypothetical protein